MGTRSLLVCYLELVCDIHLHVKKTGTYLGHARLSMRFLTVSLILFFYEISGTDYDLQWECLRAREFISEKEWGYLKRYQPQNRNMIVMRWAGEVYHDSFAIQHKPSNILN